ncbi:hypothetical protein ASG78_10500 [Nostocoides sp. Soil756]|nr:hypothetical protein ASG78_10500 [Tetrasphaera sp. Soil756]
MVEPQAGDEDDGRPGQGGLRTGRRRHPRTPWRRSRAAATGTATATTVVRQPSGRGRQQAVQETRLPPAVVVDHRGKGRTLRRDEGGRGLA